jgi:GTPase involved in cell partitioning and DNA repair
VNYGAQIESKKEIIALNKIEISDEDRVKKIKKEFESFLNQEVKLISAATGFQLDQLTNLCLEYLNNE